MKRIIVISLLVFSASFLFSQIDKSTQKALNKVQLAFDNRHFEEARYKLEAIPLNKNILYKYWIAKIEFALGNLENSEKLLNKIYNLGTLNYSFEENTLPFDVYTLMANIKLRQLKADQALDILYFAKKKSASSSSWQSIINQEIMHCNTFKEFYKIPEKSQIKLNKDWSSKNNEILFTSSADLTKLVYAFEVQNELGVNIKQKGIGMFLSGLPKESKISSISVDSRYLLFIYDDDIFVTSWQKGFWKKSEILPEPINSSAIEKNAIFSSDNRTILFSSNREGGYGGFDIYIVKKQEDETWGEAVNLGSKINSSADEINPFLSADFNHLYFSSNGRKTMGGYDIFVSTVDEENNWTEAKNMGYPINTPSDETNFWLHPNNADSYLISNRPNGIGQNDIYKTTLIPDDEADNFVLMVGTVAFENEKPIENVQITITDKKNEEVAGVFIPNKTSGKFLFLLPPEKEYKAIYEAQGYLSYINYFYVSQDSAYYKIKQGVNLEPITFHNPPTGILNQKIIIHDIFFEKNSTEIIDNYQNELNNLSLFLKKNPQAVIQINAYSDATSSESYNIALTQKRANAAKKYLMKNGVNGAQVIAKGMGEQNPIALNNSEKGRKYNRRIEFKLIAKGNQTIEILPIFVPKELRIK